MHAHDNLYGYIRKSVTQSEKIMRSFNCICVLFKLRNRYMYFTPKIFHNYKKINSLQSEN